MQLHAADRNLEFELSGDEVIALTQSRPPRISAPPRRPPISSRAVLGIGATALVAVAAGAIAYRSAATLPSVPQMTALAAPAAAVAPAPSAAQPELPRVRFANPFDRTEVFEFPAGTSRAEAREKVADLLMKRAQERRQEYGRTTAAHRARSTNR